MRNNFSTLKNGREAGISKKKKMLHSVISASVVASAVVPINAIATDAANDAIPSAPENGTSVKPAFPDVPKNAFFHDAVVDLTNKGTVSGYPDGTFKPAKQVTRAEAAAMLVKDLSLDTGQSENNPTHFKDISQSDWFYDAVTALSQKGIIGGYEDGSFKPNQTVTRAELTKLLVAAYNLSSNQDHKEVPFKDVPTNSWYLEPLQTLNDHALVSGKTSTQFGPNDPVNRGEIAVFIARINEFLKNPVQLLTQKIESVKDETATINGKTYQIDANIKGILNSKNATALKNAELSFEESNNTITKITALTIKASGQSTTKGQSEFSKNITLDAAGNNIDGNLIIDGNFVTVKNAVISGDLEITKSLKNDFYSENLTVNGETEVNGGDDNTVVFKDATLQQVHVSKQNVHLKAAGKTTTDGITLSSNSTVTADKDVKIKSLTIAAGANQVELNAQIQDLNITNEKETKLTGVTNIDRLTLDSATKLKLDIKGTIKVLKVTDKNTRITLGKDVTVEKYELPDGVKIEDIVTKYSSSSGSGGGSSNDDDDDDSGSGGGGGTNPDPNPDPSETQSHAPSLSNISIVNNRGTEDTLTIKNVALNSTIRIYSSPTDDRILKSATANDSTVTIPGLDLGTEAGSIWVSTQNPGKTESPRTKIDYASEVAGASGIAINKSSFTLAPSASEALTAALNLPDITPGEVTFTWESLDEDIATVTNTGVVTAHVPGKVLIKVSATLPNSTTISATSELTVYEEVEIALFEGAGVILGPPTPAPLKVIGTVKLEDTPDAKDVNVSIGLPEVPADAKLTVSKLPEDIPTPPKDAPFIALDIAVEGYRDGEQFRIEMDIPEGLNEDSPGAYHYNSDTGIWEYREGKIENGKFVFMTDLSPISIWKRVPAPKHATITVTEDKKYKLTWVGSVDDTYYKVFDGDKVLNPRIEASEFELPPLNDGMHYLYVRAYRVGNPDSPLPIKATFESAISNVVPLRIGAEDETIYISNFALSAANLALNVGDTETIFTAVDPYNATEPLIWASTNPYVASVDQHGVVHAKAPGTTTINVFPLNNPAAVQRVNVVVKGGDNVSVTPEEQELTLAAGERSNAIPVEAIFNPQAKVDKLDVVFAFDTTGSMSGAIDSAKENAIDIMNLIRTQVSDAQFGVISFEDYEGYNSESEYSGTYGGPNDDPYIMNQAVTDNPQLVQDAINVLFADNGNDTPESYTRALYELSDQTPRVDSVRWRSDAKKVIVLFGDAPTHDLDFAGENFGEDPGRDGIGGTSDDLRFVEVVDSLRAQGIIVLAVDSYYGYNATLQGMSIGYLPFDGEKWQGTEGTNGKYVSLDNASLPDIVDDFVTEHAKTISSIKITAPEPYHAWIETDPEELNNVPMPTEEPITNKFNLFVQPPTITPEGTYEFEASVFADGVELGTILLKINVGEAVIARPVPNVTTSEVPSGAKITLTATDGDVIHYTTDGTTPTADSPVFAGGDTITITENKTVNAIAIRKNDDGTVKMSDVMSMDYKILTLTPPTANPAAGTILRSGNFVDLMTNYSGARIYYTTNGTEPTLTSTVYRSPLQIYSGTTIKAMAVVKTTINGEELVTTSDVATFNYYVSELNNYDYLDTFIVGDINLFYLSYEIRDNLEVSNPEKSPGAIVPVADFTNLTGISIYSEARAGSIVVKVNGVVVPEVELATKEISPGDTIVVSVTAEDGLSTRHYKVTFIEAAPPVIPLMEIEKVEVAPIPGEELQPETPPTDGLEPGSAPGSSSGSGDVPGDEVGSEETPLDEDESNDNPGGDKDPDTIPEVITEPEADSNPDSETKPEGDITPDSPIEGSTDTDPAFDSNQDEGVTGIEVNSETLPSGDNLTLNVDGTIGSSYMSPIFDFIFSPSNRTVKTISLQSTLANKAAPAIVRLTGGKWKL